MSLVFAALISAVSAASQPEAYAGEEGVNIFGNVIFGFLCAGVAIFAFLAILGYLVKPSDDVKAQKFIDEDDV